MTKRRMSEGQRNAQRRRAGQVRASQSKLPRMLFRLPEPPDFLVPFEFTPETAKRMKELDRQLEERKS